MADDTELEIVNSVDSAKVKRILFGFENSQVTVIFCGIIFSALLFMLSMIPVFPKIVVYTIAPIPSFLSVLYVVFFMVRKPPHYTQDCIEGVIADHQFKPYDKVFTRLPDGMLFEHFVLWNGFQNGIWACGMELMSPR